MNKFDFSFAGCRLILLFFCFHVISVSAPLQKQFRSPSAAELKNFSCNKRHQVLATDAEIIFRSLVPSPLSPSEKKKKSKEADKQTVELTFFSGCHGVFSCPKKKKKNNFLLHFTGQKLQVLPHIYNRA